MANVDLYNKCQVLAAYAKMAHRIRPNVTMADQAAQVLRERLKRHYYKDGRLPGENAIAAELGVSRGTVRQALTILEREGVVFRLRGAGTFSNPPVLRINARLDVAYEFTHLIELSGFKAAIDTVAVRREAASPDLARRLSVRAETPVLTTRKVFLADGQPAIFVIENITVSLIRESFDDAELSRPIFEFLDNRCHVRVDYIVSEIIPCAAQGEPAVLLKIDSGQAVLNFMEVFYSQSSKPLAVATVYFRDPLIRFHALRKMSYPI